MDTSFGLLGARTARKARRLGLSFRDFTNGQVIFGNQGLGLIEHVWELGGQL